MEKGVKTNNQVDIVLDTWKLKASFMKYLRITRDICPCRYIGLYLPPPNGTGYEFTSSGWFVSLLVSNITAKNGKTDFHQIFRMARTSEKEQSGTFWGEWFFHNPIPSAALWLNAFALNSPDMLGMAQRKMGRLFHAWLHWSTFLKLGAAEVCARVVVLISAMFSLCK